jgi:hypothetical protein
MNPNSEMQIEPTIDDFPPEIMHHITAHLPHDEQERAWWISPKWRKITSDREFIYRAHYYIDLFALSEEDVVYMYLRCGRYYDRDILQYTLDNQLFINHSIVRDIVPLAELVAKKHTWAIYTRKLSLLAEHGAIKILNHIHDLHIRDIHADMRRRADSKYVHPNIIRAIDAKHTPRPYTKQAPADIVQYHIHAFCSYIIQFFEDESHMREIYFYLIAGRNIWKIRFFAALGWFLDDKPRPNYLSIEWFTREEELDLYIKLNEFRAVEHILLKYPYTELMSLKKIIEHKFGFASIVLRLSGQTEQIQTFFNSERQFTPRKIAMLDEHGYRVYSWMFKRICSSRRYPASREFTRTGECEDADELKEKYLSPHAKLFMTYEYRHPALRTSREFKQITKPAELAPMPVDPELVPENFMSLM